MKVSFQVLTRYSYLYSKAENIDTDKKYIQLINL